MAKRFPRLWCLAAAVALFLLWGTVRAQWVQTKGPCGGCISVLCVQDTVLFAGNDEGKIFRSTDYGNSWFFCKEMSGRSILSMVASDSSLFIGLSRGGIFRSNDHGASWDSLTGPFPDASVPVLLAHKGMLFAGFYENGVYRSEDSGRTWQKAAGNGLVIANSMDAMAASDAALYLSLFTQGVCRSTDRGENWTTMKIGTRDIYATDCLFAQGKRVFGGRWDAVYRSLDDGVTWEVSQNGFSQPNISSIFAWDSTLFFGSDVGVYRSEDLGVTWRTVSSAGLRSHSISALATVGTRIFAGSDYGGVYRSPDSGKHWEDVNRGMVTAPVYSLARCGSFLIAGTGSGVSVSGDSGATWSPYSPDLPPDPYVNALTVAPPVVVAATLHDGIYRSIDSGKTWTASNTGITDTFIIALVTSGDRMFAGTGQKGLFRSDDLGATWTNVTGSDINGKRINHLYAQNGRIAASAGDGGVLVSKDNGTIWSQSGHPAAYCEMVAMYGDTLLATSAGMIYRSSDWGTTWNRVDSGFGGIDVRELAVKGDTLFAADANGIYYAIRDNFSWTRIGSTGQPGWVCSMLIDRTTIYAGTEYDGAWKYPLNALPVAAKYRPVKRRPFAVSQLASVGDHIALAFSLNTPEILTMEVFDLTGKKVAVLMNRNFARGAHRALLPCGGLSSGSYLLKLIAGKHMVYQKLALVR